MKFIDAEFVKGFIRMAKTDGSRDGMREMAEICPIVLNRGSRIRKRKL